MELIQNNPYRIACILSNASERELQKQKAKMKAYSKVGKEIKSDYDFQILENITRTEDSIDKAFSKVEQNQDKVNFALFWFLNTNPFDNTAIEYLKNGDEEKAIEIWKKVTRNKEVNSKNFSAFNNLGTYKLLSQIQDDIKEGIEAKIKLIESDFFENFVHSVADETFTIDKEKQIEKMIDELLRQFKNQYSSSETLQLFNKCNSFTQKYLSQKFTEEPIHKIESQIESCKKKRKENKSDAYNIGTALESSCHGELKFLKSLLGSNDLKYKMIADQLAKEIMQCGIDYFQEWKETKDPIEESLKLLKYAKSIAVGSQIIERIKSNLEGLDEYKNKDTYLIIYILEQILDVYKELEYNFSTEQTISVNEGKVIKMMKEYLTVQNVSKIASSNNSETIQKFFSLIDYIFGEIGKNNYTYSIATSFFDSLPNESAFKTKAEKLLIKIKPTIGSVVSGGCLGEIVHLIIVLIIIGIIAFLIDLFD